MAKDNNKFTGKNRLDIEARKYSWTVYDYFDSYRKNGWGKPFGRYYYPAMIAICCDKDEKMIRGSFSDKGSVEEYKLTGMLDEMAADFNHGQPIIDRDTFTEKSLNKFPIGHCAEQHATNELLFCERWDKSINKVLNIKKDVYFSIAVRPSTGEAFDYCENCKKLFNL